MGRAKAQPARKKRKLQTDTLPFGRASLIHESLEPRFKCMNAVQDRHTLEVALRVLQACVFGLPPDEADMVYLRAYTADAFTPSQELSREVVQGLLRRTAQQERVENAP